jgi:Uncharacterized protein, 4-oxalocrotonate tautomerase homolog
MPYIKIEMFEGRDLLKKQELVAAVTDTVSRILEVPIEKITVSINECKQENWAVGGILFSNNPVPK